MVELRAGTEHPRAILVARKARGRIAPATSNTLLRVSSCRTRPIKSVRALCMKPAAWERAFLHTVKIIFWLVTGRDVRRTARAMPPFVANLRPGTLTLTLAGLGEEGRSRYYVHMAQRLRFAQAVLLILPFTLLGGCKPKTKNTPVVVHVLRDLRSVYGVELDRRLLEFQGSNPRLSDGQLIVIQSATGDYKDMLQKQTSSSENIDFIILDSPDDASSNPALQIAMTHAINICAGLKACPANVPSIIPPQIKGNQQEAALAFQNALLKTPQ